MATFGGGKRLLALVPWIWAGVWTIAATSAAAAGGGRHEFPRDGTVIELDDSNFDAAIAAFDLILVDFYAPWCGHCKRLAPELDEAAPILAGLSEPIVIAKINADKYRKLASKYDIDGFPTLKLFTHGIPIEYTGPRKAELLIHYLKKFAAPDISLLESDSAISTFVDTAGANFPIFIGFELKESLIVDYARKYKKKAWFSVAREFSEEMLVSYDFDKVPALVSLHPKYNEQSVFYGPFEGDFLEDYIRQSLLPLTVPINSETLKLFKDDKRNIVLTIMEDELDERSAKLVKVLRSAATANRDLVFGYVGLKQWGEFVDSFDISKDSQLPKMLVWNGSDEYHLVEGWETVEEEDQGSQISRFLEGYREGRVMKKKVTRPSLLGSINSLIGIKLVYLVIFVVAVLMLVQYLIVRYLISQSAAPPARRAHIEMESLYAPASETKSSQEGYQPGHKQD